VTPRLAQLLCVRRRTRT